MKKQWIDIMFGDKFHRKFKYIIDTRQKSWAEDLTRYVLDTYPYLRHRKEFSLWFDLPNATNPVSLIIRPQKEVHYENS